MRQRVADVGVRYRIESIPAELKALDRWCVTQAVPQADGTTRKRILIAGTTGGGALAKVDDPKTWRSFEVAERDAKARGFWPTFVFDQTLMRRSTPLRERLPSMRHALSSASIATPSMG
jgi:hypothetical protein